MRFYLRGIGRLLWQDPTVDASPAGAEITAAPAGAEITDHLAAGSEADNGTSPAPETQGRNELISRGVKIGIAKAEKRAMAQAIAALGFEGSLDDVRAQLDEWRASQPTDEDGAPAQAGTGDEIQRQARELRKSREEARSYRAEVETLRARADQARVDRIRAAALSGGVCPTMVDDFVQVHGSRVRWTEDGSDIEVLSPDDSGELLPIGDTLDELVNAILKAKPAYAAPTLTGGSGGGPQPLQGQPGAQQATREWDSRSLRQRTGRGRR